MRDTQGDEFTGRMLEAINSMLVEMMAAFARKDYEQRRQRQAQGIQKAKAAGKYQGRQIDEELHRRVKELLAASIGIRCHRQAHPMLNNDSPQNQKRSSRLNFQSLLLAWAACQQRQ